MNFLILSILIIGVLLLIWVRRRSHKEMREDLRGVVSRITLRAVFRLVEAIIASAILCLAGLLPAMFVAKILLGGDEEGAMWIGGMVYFMIVPGIYIAVVFLYYKFRFVRNTVRLIAVTVIILLGIFFLKVMK
jgi:hypothetical protein